MKKVLGISAIARLFGITGASAEEQVTGKNLVPAAYRHAPYYGSRRGPRYGYSPRYGYYRGRAYRYGYGGDLIIGHGPYPDRLTPGGVLTGPIPRSAHGG